MSRVNPFYESVKNYKEIISNLTGIDSEVVQTVIDGLNLCILNDVYQQGLENAETDELKTKWVRVDIPGAGTAWLAPVNRNKVDNGVEGYTFKCNFNIDKKLLSQLKSSYFLHENHLLNEVQRNFSEKFPKNLKSLL